MSTLRQFGLDLVGDVPWGTHLCQFYETRDDLIDILVPYFAAGLRSNEVCMWVTSEPLDVDEATAALAKVIPNLDHFLESGQLKIFPYHEWYLKDGTFDQDRVLQAWVDAEQSALTQGFAGVRLSGNTMWIERSLWDAFVDYEAAINTVVGGHRMLVLCTYSLTTCSGTDVIDVVRNHEGTIIKQGGEWTVVEDVVRRKETEGALQQAHEKVQALNEELQVANEELDQRVQERTEELTSMNEELRNETTERTRAEREARARAQRSAVLGEIIHVLNEAQDLSTLYERTLITTIKQLGFDKGFIATTNTGGQFDVQYAHNYPPEFVEEINYLNVDSNTYTRALYDQKQLVIMDEAQPDSVSFHHGMRVAVVLIPFLSEGSAIGHLALHATAGRSFSPEERELFQTVGREFGTAMARLQAKARAEEYARQQDVINRIIKAGNEADTVSKALGVMLDAAMELINFTDGSVYLLNEADGVVELQYARGFTDEAIEAARCISLTTSFYAEVYKGMPQFLNEYQTEGTEQFAELLPDIRILALTPLVAERRVIGHYVLASARESPFTDEEQALLVAIGEQAGTVIARLQAEEQARAASRYARSLIEASLDPLVTINAQGTITDVNRATEEATGCSREELMDSDFSDYFTEPDKAKAGYERVFADGFVRDYPLALRHRSDRVTDVLYNATLFRDERGEVQGVFAAARDITDRKRAEAQLRATSLYARNLIEASLDPLVTISAEGKITDVNKATEEVTGYLRHELIGSDFSDYFTEPDEARKGYERVFADGFVKDYPLRIRHKTGILTDVLYNATVYRNEAGESQGVFAAARDITERKRAEAQLRATSLYARSLIEASLDPLVTISAEGKITDVNKATEEVTGYLRHELIGSDFSDYFTEPNNAKAGYQQVFANGFVRDYPLALRHRSGRITDVLYNATVYRNEVGKVQGVFAAARDVTERKRAEAAVQEYAHQLEIIHNVIKAGNEAADLQSAIVSMLDNAVSLTGFEDGAIYLLNAERTVAELQYASGGQASDANHIAVTNRHVARVYEGVPSFSNGRPSQRYHRGAAVTAHIPLSSKGVVIGHYVVSSTTPHQFSESEKELLHVLGHEAGTVIARLQAEEQLRWEHSLDAARVELYEPLISPTSDFDETTLTVIEQAKRVTDSRHGYVGLIDPISKSMVVYSHTAMMTSDECAVSGKDKRLEFPIGADDQYPGLWGYALNTKQPFYTNDPSSHQTSIGAPEGHIPLERYLKVPVLIGDELVAAVAVANASHDYTQKDADAISRIGDMLALAITRLRADEALQQYTDHLEDLVAERTAQLKDAERLAGIGETATMIGHDLRNPLQGLQYMVDLQKLRFERTPPDERGAGEWANEAAFLDKVSEQIIYMDKIVSDLQDYARPVAPHLETVSLSTLIDEVLQQAPHDGVHVTTALDGISIAADRHLVRRVFTNLILNALQAMPDGGTLTISANAVNASVVISVQDTGVGIPQEMRDKLFLPLTTGKAKGTGLGLAVVKRIVDAHNGAITFASEEGKGTTFVVTLPQTAE